MANQLDQDQFDDVYQLEKTDPVLGGLGGITNKPLLNLANRTRYLLNRISEILGISKNYSAAGGTANAVSGTYAPAITALTDGMVLRFKGAFANTGAATFTPNTASSGGIAAAPIYGRDHQPLTGGEIVVAGNCSVQWNISLNSGNGGWVLLENTGGAQPVAAAVASNHALQLGQAKGRLLRTLVYTLGASSVLMVSINGAAPVAASSTFSPLAATLAVKVKAQGAGGGGGGAQANSASTISTGNGGAAGGYSESWFTSGFSGVTVTVGVGAGGVLSGTAGTGGTTSFGSLLSVVGGTGGGSGLAVGPPTSGSNISGGVIGPTPTGGNLVNVRGGFGWFSILATTPVSGAGGRSYFGDGGIYVSGTSGGQSATVPGAGGGGGCSGLSGPNAGGGNGFAGILIVEEYA